MRDYVGLSGAALSPSGFETGVENFVNPHPCHEYAWGIADLLSALLSAGLQLRSFVEYPYTNGARSFFDDMRELPGRCFTVPEGTPELPLLFGLTAEKLA